MARSFRIGGVALLCMLCIGCGKGVLAENGKSESISFSILGDSISSFAGSSPKGYPVYYSEIRPSFDSSSPWWSQFSEMSNWRFFSNSSYAGGTISKYSSEQAACFFSDERIEVLSQKGIPDYVFILGGTNDWSRSVKFEGDDPQDSTTFVGAYRYLIYKVKRLYSSTNIVCLSILPRDSGIDTMNRESWTIRNANEKISSICSDQSCLYVDLTDCGILNNIDFYTYDGLHPNALGMRLIAQCVVGKLTDVL